MAKPTGAPQETPGAHRSQNQTVGGEGIGARRLRAGWEIIGRFDQDYEVTYLLYSPEYHKLQYTLTGALWQFRLRRKHLDSELTYLAGLIRQLDPEWFPVSPDELETR